MKITYFNIQRFSLHDGEGIRTSVFFKGCPLRCKWCHNPESHLIDSQIMHYQSKCVKCGACLKKCNARSISDGEITIDIKKCNKCRECINVCPYDANEICGKTLDTEDVIKEVLKDQIFYGENGGMTLTGGEPAFQSASAIELIKNAKEYKINTTIETCGYGDKDFFIEAGKLGATFLFDIKGIDDKKHIQNTGVSNKIILENLQVIFDNNFDVVIRIPLIPTMNDSDEDLQLLCDYLNTNKDKIKSIEVLSYHNLGLSKAHGIFKKYDAPKENATNKDKSRWKTIFEKNNINIEI